MDWTTIITSIVSVICGGGLVGIFTIPQIKKKASAEAGDAAIEALNKAIDTLRNESNTWVQRYNELYEKYTQRGNLYEDKCEESATAKSMLCIHLGCVLRDPLLGQGDTWMEQHRTDMALNTDYLPVNVLMKRLEEKNKAKQENGTE